MRWNAESYTNLNIRMVFCFVLFLLLVFWNRVSVLQSRLSWNSVDKAGFKLTGLPLPHNCWKLSHTPPCLVLFIYSFFSWCFGVVCLPYVCQSDFLWKYAVFWSPMNVSIVLLSYCWHFMPAPVINVLNFYVSKFPKKLGRRFTSITSDAVSTLYHENGHLLFIWKGLLLLVWVFVCFVFWDRVLLCSLSVLSPYR